MAHGLLEDSLIEFKRLYFYLAHLETLRINNKLKGFKRILKALNDSVWF